MMNLESDDEGQGSDQDLLTNEANFLYAKFQDSMIVNPKSSYLHRNFTL